MTLTLAEPAPFSLIEKLILIATVALSGYLFWRRFSAVLGRILAAKKDAGWQLRPLGPRLKALLWEVALQAKVIRQRPLAGLAHALVFWGFLAFVLVTCNHFAGGLGLGFLSPEGWFGRLYFTVAALFAVACVVGIAGLFVRRFLIRPKWLGEKPSWESGLIAGLIFLLMVTYLAAYFLSDGGWAIHTLWWVHTVALLAFLPIVPHTKHLHLVLSPATVFLGRSGFSAIPRLNGDEDFGLIVGQDLTRLVALQAYSCVECGRCTEHCPAAATGKALNPKEVILGLRAYLNEIGPASEAPLIEKLVAPQVPFQCTTCGACEFQCPVGVEHLPILVGLRRGAVNTGAWEDEYGARLFNTLERSGNPLGMSAAERDKFIARAGLPWFDGTQEYCLWLGCMGAYDAQGRETVLALKAVLDRLGVSYGVLRREKCSGDAARRLGNDLLFEQLASFNLEQMAEAGVKKLLSICPHCVRTISVDWREHGQPPAVEHHSEFLARHLPKLNLVQDQEKIVFHDPCYLGRYRGVYDEPRSLIQAVGQKVEAPRSGGRSFCCGAGGGLTFLGEEQGERISHVRTRELAATGAQTIAVACPFCASMFRDAGAAVAGERAQPVEDIAQLAARGLDRAQAGPKPVKIVAETSCL